MRSLLLTMLDGPLRTLILHGGALVLALVTACAPAGSTGGRGDDVGERKPGAGATETDGTDPDGNPRSGTGEDPDFFDPVDTSQLDPFFTDHMKTAGFPGLSVAVVRGGKLKWAKGYGLAHIAESRRVTKDTLFMLASVSKTVNGVALMQLLEDKSRGLSLDQNIEDKLPFAVRNPRFSSTPITYRMLLTHTSTLIDSARYWEEAEDRPEGDAALSLLDFERAYVARSDSWGSRPPGARYEYSNTATALAGLLVERISGMNLQEYCKAKVFEPLQMKESSWFFAGLDPTHIAMPYDTNLRPQGHYGFPDYPDGQLRTSAAELARFLMMFASKGEYKGARILSEATVLEMQREQFPSLAPGQGLSFYYNTFDDTRVLGHNGSYIGVSTEMYVDPETGAGFILLANSGDPRVENDDVIDAVNAMDDKLMSLAKTLP